MRLDQSNYSGAIGVGFGDLGAGRDYMGMGFIPTYNSVVAVSFWLNSKDADTAIGYKVWIDAADASFFPTGAVGVGIGGATEITNAQLTTGSLVLYNLASQVSLTPGNRYIVMFAPWNTTTHAWAASYNDWTTSVSNPYANGRRIHGDTAFTTFDAPDSGNADLQFETWAADATSVKSIFNKSLRPRVFAPGLAR